MEERQKIMHFSKRGARGAIDLPVFYIMICPAFYTSKSVTFHSAPRTESLRTDGNGRRNYFFF